MKRKKIRAALTSILIPVFLIVLFSGCGSTEEVRSYKQGEPFTLDKYDYKLDSLLLLPQFDTDAAKGYGVVLLHRGTDTPMQISMNGGSSNIHSLVDLSLIDGEKTIVSHTVSFKIGSMISEYPGITTVVFRLPADSAFPAHGIFAYNGGDDPVTVSLDFTGMQAAAESSDSEVFAKPSAAPAGSDPK